MPADVCEFSKSRVSRSHSTVLSPASFVQRRTEALVAPYGGRKHLAFGPWLSCHFS